MIGYYLGAEGCNGVDWIPVAQRWEKRGIAVNLGYLCTCYSFKKGLLREVAKNLNPSYKDLAGESKKERLLGRARRR